MDVATKRGYIIVLSLLAGAIILRAIIPFFIQENSPTPIPKSWERELNQLNRISHSPYSTETKESHSTVLQPEYFDPNTVTENVLQRMQLPEKTIRQFINWRNKGKTFYTPDDFGALYALTEAEYAQLKPYIKIAAKSRDQATFNRAKFTPREKVPDKIFINTTTQHTLALLPGIGPASAAAIIKQRDALGGFYNFDQIKACWRFDDSIYALLKKIVIIDLNSINKIAINAASEQQLSAHPYIKETMAKNIIRYRESIKGYQQIEQLKQVPLMDAEKYRKIAPYFTVD